MLPPQWGAGLPPTLMSRDLANANPGSHQMHISAHSSSSTLSRIIHEFDPTIETHNCFVEQLCEGGQAHIFAVRLHSGRSSAQADTVLVIKLYKLEATPTADLVHAEFESLSRLYTALAGTSMDGWEIFVPAPLHICKSPLALVMTMVPGRPLDLYLGLSKNLMPEILEAVPRIVVAAMGQYWSAGKIYGELCFTNILCDTMARRLSFVDPGAPSNAFCCDGVSKQWYPASHDLGYLLYDTQARLKRHLTNPKAWIRERLFTENVLRAHLDPIQSFDERQSFLIEIRACAREHLKKLERPWSARGIWCAFIRQVASRQIDAVINRLKPKYSTDGIVTSGTSRLLSSTRGFAGS